MGNLALPSTTAPRWRDRAACAGADPELFFPVTPGDEAAAKAVCHRCPVAAACFTFAYGRPGTTGIWGGTTENERANYARRMRRAARRTAAA
jgi:WhiB family transcriptional regulator, redox-sensing transcriptional regulator